MAQQDLESFDYKKYGSTRSTKAGYGPVASNGFANNEDPPTVDDRRLASLSGVSKPTAKRLLNHFDGFEGVVRAANEDDPIEALCECPGISNRIAAMVINEYGNEK